MKRSGLSLGLSIALLLAGCGGGGGGGGGSGNGSAPPPGAPTGPTPRKVPLPIGGSSTPGSSGPSAPVVTGPSSPLGAAPQRVAEPAVAPDRSSPASVLTSLDAAIKAKDAATIARIETGPHGKPNLDASDLAHARRDFLDHGLDAYWLRVISGVDRTRLASLAAPGAAFKISITMGDALGSVELGFAPTTDGWTIKP